MHKTFISYHHENEQNLKNELIELHGNEDFIDVSVGDSEIDPNLEEDAIMRIIREEYLHDSTVTLVLVGCETAQRPYVNSEIQASLRDTVKNKHNGLVAVVRDDLYDYIFSKGICSCGCNIRLINLFFYQKHLPNLIIKNHQYRGNSCHYNDSEVYCSIVKYSLFKIDPESYINEAHDKRDDNAIQIIKLPDPGTPRIGQRIYI